MAKGDKDDPFESEDEAIRALECFFHENVYVTESVFSSFDWKAHLDQARSGGIFCIEYVVGDSEEGAYPRIIQAYRHKDGGFCIGYDNLSEDKMEELLRLAEIGYRSLNHKNEKEMTNV